MAVTLETQHLGNVGFLSRNGINGSLASGKLDNCSGLTVTVTPAPQLLSSRILFSGPMTLASRVGDRRGARGLLRIAVGQPSDP